MRGSQVDGRRDLRADLHINVKELTWERLQSIYGDLYGDVPLNRWHEKIVCKEAGISRCRRIQDGIARLVRQTLHTGIVGDFALRGTVYFCFFWASEGQGYP